MMDGRKLLRERDGGADGLADHHGPVFRHSADMSGCEEREEEEVSRCPSDRGQCCKPTSRTRVVGVAAVWDRVTPGNACFVVLA
jgi:hypothetical protein